MLVSRANSLTFVKRDSLKPSMANTLAYEQQYLNHLRYTYFQIYVKDDVLPIQVRATLLETITLTQYFLDGSASVVHSVSDTNTYSTFKSLSYNITLSSAKQSYFIASNGTDEWQSELIDVWEEDDDSLLLIQWHNNDNAFEFDYSDDIVNFVRIEGLTKGYKPKIKSTVHDNQEELVKLKSTIYRQLKMELEPVPQYMSEKIALAGEHDTFLINDIEYTIEEAPETESLEMTNLQTYSVVITETNTLGINTDDLGYDCEALTEGDVVQLEELNAGSDLQFTVTSGYLIQSMTAFLNTGSGDATINGGSTVGGNDMAFDEVLETGNTQHTWTINQELPSGTTFYVGISGTAVDVDIHIILIKNRLT